MIGTSMFDIGLQELVVIFVIALLVFGPKNLPQLGRALGRAMREFRKASDEFRSTIETNLQINEPDPIPTPTIEPMPAESTPAWATADGGDPTDRLEWPGERGERARHSRRRALPLPSEARSSSTLGTAGG